MAAHTPHARQRPGGARALLGSRGGHHRHGHGQCAHLGGSIGGGGGARPRPIGDRPASRRSPGAGRERARRRDRRRAARGARRSGRGAAALAHLPAHRGGLPLCGGGRGRRVRGRARPSSSARSTATSVRARSSRAGYLQRGPAGLSPMIFPEHGDEHDGLGGGDRGGRAGAVGHAQPADHRRRPRGGARRRRSSRDGDARGRRRRRRGRDLRARLSPPPRPRRAVADAGRRAGGLPALCGGSQWPGARRGRDVSRARGSRRRARAGGEDRRRARGSGLGERAGVGARGAAGSGGSRLARRPPPRARTSVQASAACTAPGTAIAGVDDWERGLLARDLGPCDVPPLSLAPLFGQHGGLGALRVAAAALDAARGVSPVLVHGIARGGCRTALIVGALDPAGREPTVSDHPDRHPRAQRGRHHRRRGAGRRAPRRRPRRGRRLDGRLERGRGGRRRRRDPARRGGAARARRFAAGWPRRSRATRSASSRWTAMASTIPTDLPRLLAAAAQAPDALVIGGRLGRDRAVRGGGAPSLRPGRGDARGRILHRLAHRRRRVRHAIGLSRVPRRPVRRRAPAPRRLRARVRDAGRRGRPRMAPRRGARGGHPLRRAARAASVPFAMAPPSAPTWRRGSRGAGAGRRG